MLKFNIRKETSDLGKTGVMTSYVVDAGGLSCLFTCVAPDEPKAGEPLDPWRLYVLGGACSEYAASVLHCLELGIVATARWIAVELLKDPSQPTRDATGAVLWFPRSEPNVLLLSGVAMPARVEPTPSWSAVAGWVTMVPDDWPLGLNRMFATREGALTYAIELAAPWIAAALEQEVAP